jgi:hypothetical protein
MKGHIRERGKGNWYAVLDVRVEQRFCKALHPSRRIPLGVSPV